MTDPMPGNEQYGSLAVYYDAIYHWKDYPTEVAALRGLLESHGVRPGGRILEAACGTGSHLVHLASDFEVSGLDRSEAMLEFARKKLPGVTLWQGDLRSFEVEQPADAVLCLFSSIGYLLTREDLESAARCFAQATKHGGVVLLEPWFTPEVWQVGLPTLHKYESADLKLARATVAERDCDIAIMDMNWLIAERGRPVRHVVDRHEMWLCPHELLQEIFEAAGFAVTWSEALGARRLLIGERR